jgi:mono/diheme cytochrome c family protein
MLHLKGLQPLIRVRALAILLAAFAVPLSAFAEGATNGLSPAKNYALDCQGCHMSDGSGYPGRIPSLRGNVSRYLSVPEGRTYIVQVPGSSQSMLSDRDLTDVLNWIVQTLDPGNLPASFVPYQEAEVAKLRREPLSAPSVLQAKILAELGNMKTASEAISKVGVGSALGSVKY